MTRLEELPARMDRLESQIVQLRTEIRAEFSAAREEARAGDDRVVAALREEIRAGDAETRSFMRALHEKIVSDIATIGEARPTPRRTRSKKKPRS